MILEDDRICKDEYYLKIAEIVSIRSTCLRHKFGCVITKADKIVSTGYNGAVRKSEHCISTGCVRNKLGIPSGMRIEICEAVHAEQNAIIQAGKYAEDGNLYVNGTPCKLCSKLIVNSSIKKVIIPANDNYADKEGLRLLKKIGIDVIELIPVFELKIIKKNC